MEEVASAKRKPPVGLHAAVGASLLSIALALVLFIGRTSYPTWAARFVVAIWFIAFMVQYRNQPYRRAGLKRAPPFFEMPLLHAVIQAVFWSAFWLAFVVLMDGPSTAAFRVATFVGLGAGSASYRRYHWAGSGEGWSFQLAAGIAAAVLSVPLGSLLEKVLLR